LLTRRIRCGTIRNLANATPHLEPEMKRLSHHQMNDSRAQALVRGYFPCANLALEDRFVSGETAMA